MTRILKTFALVGFVFFLLIHAREAQCSVIYVKAGATGANNGKTWGNAYAHLQNALTNAIGGDAIWVAQGDYGSISMTPGVAIYGGFNGTESTLDQRNWTTNQTVLSSGNIGGYQAILDGFTISGVGCGMINIEVSPTIVNCTFTGNTNGGGIGQSGDGGGMYNISSSPMVTNCTFIGNTTTDGSGGGMYNALSSPTVTNCTFTNNTARLGFGGGMCFSGGSPTVTNCTFTGNQAGGGGGLCNDAGTVTNCIFTNNVATGGYSSGSFGNGYGGGMSIGSGTVTNCIFTNNAAHGGVGFNGYGGGMSNGGTVTNCIFINNAAHGINHSGFGGGYGGGMCNEGNIPMVTNCTFTGNAAYSGGGVYNDQGSSVTLTNDILWGDRAEIGAEYFNYISNASFNHCNKGNPLFVNINNPIGSGWFTMSSGLALLSSSPCLNAGTTVGAPLTDILGNSWVGGVPDIGAYQYYPPISSKNSVKDWEHY